jgi:hypothetical protein
VPYSRKTRRRIPSSTVPFDSRNIFRHIHFLHRVTAKTKNLFCLYKSSSQKEALLYSHLSTGFKSRLFRKRTDLLLIRPIFLRKRNDSALVRSLFTRASAFFKACVRNHKHSFTNEQVARICVIHLHYPSISRTRACSIMIYKDKTSSSSWQ